MGDRPRGIYNNVLKKARRKELRNSATAAEKVLWKRLQNRQILGKKFRRQYSIGRYIVDFYCAESRVIVELDGKRHFSMIGEEYEIERTRYLEGLGLRIVRFENKTLYKNPEAVLETIREAIREVGRG